MARPLRGQGLVPPMGGLFKAAPYGCGYLLSIQEPGQQQGYDNTDASTTSLLGKVPDDAGYGFLGKGHKDFERFSLKKLSDLFVDSKAETV